VRWAARAAISVREGRFSEDLLVKGLSAMRTSPIALIRLSTEGYRGDSSPAPKLPFMKNRSLIDH
jgi:hypothetical protein